MAFIEFKDICFTYPKMMDSALQNIDLQIERGEFVVLCGLSGCGKTTLLKQLKQEITPFGEMTGQIMLEHRLLSTLTEREKATRIGYVMQNPDQQLVTDKVWHELAFGLENLGVPTQEIRRKVAEMANYFGIQNWFHHDTATLSGGQKQLVNLASVMVMQPDVLLLDEPTSQLDPIAAMEFIHTVHKLQIELGITVIMVEHRLEELFSIANRVVVLDEGRIVANDAPHKVIHQLKTTKRVPSFQLSFPVSVQMQYALHPSVDNIALTIQQGQKWVRDELPQGTFFEQRNEREAADVALAIENSYFSYGLNEKDVLQDFSLQLYRGEIFTLLGGNGSGKTTAMKVMMGLLRKRSGSLSLYGKPFKKYKKETLYREWIGICPQNPQTIFTAKTVLEELQDVTSVWRCSEEEKRQKERAIAQKLMITHLFEQHPYDLSGGEQQKVALAKVLLNNPTILCLDEPTKGMDAYSKQQLAQFLITLKNEGKTIFIVTHDLEFSALYADRTALFFDGDVVSCAPTTVFFTGNHFYTTAAHRITRQWIEGLTTLPQFVEYAKKECAFVEA